LESKGYGKDIMVVETGYSYAWALGGTTFDYTGTYPYTEEGQRRFTADLITTLHRNPAVTGLFWWWPEDNGNKNVTSGWWNAALYNHNTGQPYAAFYELKAFANSTSGLRENRLLRTDDNAWYSLQGLRFENRPQRPGLYIMNGRMVIVR
jgi:arabinogalactan endo-1,4-beta-galactosidase